MDCARVEELMSLYLTGELGDSVEKQIEAHASGCEACGNSISWHNGFIKLYGQLKAAPGLDKRLIAEIGRRERGQQAGGCPNHPPIQVKKKTIISLRSVLTISIGVAAMLLLTIGLVFLLQPRSDIRLSGDARMVGDVIQTDKSGTVELPDRSIVRMDENTEVKVESIKREQGTVLYLNRGSAAFEVTRQGKAFAVKTPVGEVEVLGTKFSMTLQGGNDMKNLSVLVLLVTVHEGSVQVKNEIGHEELNAGERAVVRQDKTPEKIKEAGQDRAELCCEKHKTFGMDCAKAGTCKTCGMEISLAEKCTHDRRSHPKYMCCLACAKKDGVCPVCGDSVGAPKLEWADKDQAICQDCNKKYKAEAIKEDGREAIHYKTALCKKCGSKGGGPCCPKYHVNPPYCAECARKESVCRACLGKIHAKEKMCPTQGKCSGKIVNCAGNCGNSHDGKCKRCSGSIPRALCLGKSLCDDCVKSKGICKGCGMPLEVKEDQNIQKLIDDLGSKDEKVQAKTVEELRKLSAVSDQQSAAVLKALENAISLVEKHMDVIPNNPRPSSCDFCGYIFGTSAYDPKTCADRHKKELQMLKNRIQKLADEIRAQIKKSEEDKRWINEGKHEPANCCDGEKHIQPVWNCKRCDKNGVGDGHDLCKPCADQLGICRHCQKKIE